MKHIVGNWKMHGLQREGESLALAVASHIATRHQSDVEVVLCPPATLLTKLSTLLNASRIRLAGQDCHQEQSGAFTGCISAPMLRDAGCDFVILGHSERRQGQGETSALVSQKAKAAYQAGLTPIICIGEALADRDQGKALTVIGEQLMASLPAGVDARELIIAYEPIWAIGTGRTPTQEEIEEVHNYIVSACAGDIKVLYGGSVKPQNAAQILALNNVHGVLVGGASLKLEEFCAVIDMAASLRRVEKNNV